MATPFNFNVVFVDQNGAVLKNTMLLSDDVTTHNATDAVTGMTFVNVDYDCFIGDYTSAAAATVKYFILYRNGFDTGVRVRFAAIADANTNRVPYRYKVYKGDTLVFTCI